MMHAFIDIGDKTMCSRCGNEVKRVDEACPAVSDGEMFKRRMLTQEDIDELDRALRASAVHVYDIE